MIDVKPVPPERPICPECGAYFMPAWKICEACAGLSEAEALSVARSILPGLRNILMVDCRRGDHVEQA